MPQPVPLPVWGYVLLLAPSVAALILVLRMYFSMGNKPMPSPSGCHPRHEMPMPPAREPNAVDVLAAAFASKQPLRYFYVKEDCSGASLCWNGNQPLAMDRFLVDDIPPYNEEPI